MKNNNDALAGFTTQHIVYHLFEYQDTPPDIWYAYHSDNGLDAGRWSRFSNEYLIRACEVTLTQAHPS